MTPTSTLLIIGNGMATNRLLEALDQHHPYRQIVVLSDEQSPYYNRIMLSPLLAGETTLNAITPHDESWYRDRRIHMHYAQTVLAVDVHQHQVICDSGLQLNWDHLIFATGSRSFIPSLNGASASNVLGFRTLSDVERMQTSLQGIRHATVIGAGLLGVEAAVGLRAQGINVTLMHRNPVLMNRQLDATAARLLQTALQQRGIQIRTGCDPQTLHQNDQHLVTQLSYAHGTDDEIQSLKTDLVIFATGILPNKELAQQAGIACNKGIQVNDRMETSVAGVYALGECCEYSGNTYGLVAPIWDQVQVLSQVLLQQPVTPYTEQQHLTKLKVSGLDVHSIGDFGAEQDDCDVLTLLDEHAGIYKKLVLRNNRIIGALCVGDVRDSQWYFEHMRQETNVSDLRMTLLFGPADQSSAA